jgi:hypothetical protein
VYAFVTKREEKQSDVNLAAHMIQDAWQQNYPTAVVVSRENRMEKENS